MKRTVLLATTLAIILLIAASLIVAQPTPSVPNLINFQGRLTDNLGNPVANGAHSVHFYIFPVRTGGVSVWDEIQNPTTTGGLFTTQLGLVNTLPLTLFEDYDSLFLEIVADAQLISPRTLLSSTPSTRVANSIECKSTFTGTTYLKNFDAGDGVITYGGDGLDQIWLYGYAWGELFMFDSDPANNLNVSLGANNVGGGSPGGELTLRLAGITAIDLNAALTGDASVVVPTDAINSGEILDEPGVSNNDGNAIFFLLGSGNTDYKVDSVDITVPAAGYVEVTSSGYMNMYHTNGTRTEVWVTVDPSYPPPWIPVGSAVIGVPAGEVTDYHQIPYTTSRLFYVGGPGTYRYYLSANYASGTNPSTDLAFYFTRATYYPTLYGTVTLAKTGAAGATATSIPTALKPIFTEKATTITVADHNARLEAERAKQMAALEARVKQLEEQLKSGQYPNLAPGAPRKER